jgi:hypothetical protein
VKSLGLALNGLGTERLGYNNGRPQSSRCARSDGCRFRRSQQVRIFARMILDRRYPMRYFPDMSVPHVHLAETQADGTRQ